MVYMGSKRQYCKYIIPIIQKYIDENNIDTFIDCFVGGANVADKVNCKTVIGNDLSFDLIALHQQAQQDFSKIPTNISREDWDLMYGEWKKRQADNNYISAIPASTIGAAEWYGSFGPGGFQRSFAKPTETRNFYQERYRNHKKQAESLNYQKIKFICGSYNTIPFNDILPANILLYCDSPYNGTAPYGISKKFNFDEYYQWLLDTSKKYPIFVSEQALPQEFEKYIVWKKDDVKRTMSLQSRCKACEKLYFIDNRVK